jgi:hypothetical protein
LLRELGRIKLSGLHLDHMQDYVDAMLASAAVDNLRRNHAGAHKQRLREIPATHVFEAPPTVVHKPAWRPALSPATFARGFREAF